MEMREWPWWGFMKGTVVRRAQGKCRKRGGRLDMESLKPGGAGESGGKEIGLQHPSQWPCFNQDSLGAFLPRLSFPLPREETT